MKTLTRNTLATGILLGALAWSPADAAMRRAEACDPGSHEFCLTPGQGCEEFGSQAVCEYIAQQLNCQGAVAGQACLGECGEGGEAVRCAWGEA